MDIEKIKEMIEVYPEKGRLPCPVAHYISAYLSIPSIEVAKVCNQMGVMLYQCQLGLFGYGRKGKSSYKIVGREVEVPHEVIDRIKTRVKEGKIACQDLWEIAAEAEISRAEAGNAADSLGIKISPCQLGAF